MKSRIPHIFFCLMLIFSPLFISPAHADEPPPPPPHGTGGDWQPGGSAPAGNGTVILIVMGAAYGLKRIYNQRRRLIE